MDSKLITFSAILLFIIGLNSCSTEQQMTIKELHITVMDKNTNQTVDNAEVTLQSIINNSNILQDIKSTNADGNCDFVLKFQEDAHYAVMTNKDDLLSYFELDDSQDFVKSRKDITIETEEDIVLFLTSDSLNHINYWKEVTPFYEMEELIQLLRANSYTEGLPQLGWENITDLLAVGNDTILISNFPRNPVSSFYLDDCYLGIISLWLIESIRYSEKEQLISPFERFPSLNPILRNNNLPDEEANTREMMEKAFQAYSDWWEQVKDMNPEEACKIVPLAGSQMDWQ